MYNILFFKMDNYKQNNGELNSEHCPVQHQPSHYITLFRKGNKNKLDDGTFLIALQSGRLYQDDH